MSSIIRYILYTSVVLLTSCYSSSFSYKRNNDVISPIYVFESVDNSKRSYYILSTVDQTFIYYSENEFTIWGFYEITKYPTGVFMKTKTKIDFRELGYYEKTDSGEVFSRKFDPYDWRLDEPFFFPYYIENNTIVQKGFGKVTKKFVCKAHTLNYDY